MDRRQQRFLACMTALAAVVIVLQALTGVVELTLYLTPLFLIASLLLSGHYVAEERIARGYIAARGTPGRRNAPRVAFPSATHRLTSLLERSPLCRRGPPWAAAPLAA